MKRKLKPGSRHPYRYAFNESEARVVSNALRRFAGFDIIANERTTEQKIAVRLFMGDGVPMEGHSFAIAQDGETWSRFWKRNP